MAMKLSNMLAIIPIIRAHGLERHAMNDLEKPITHVYSKGRRFDYLSEMLGAVSFVSFSIFQFIFLMVCIVLNHRGVMSLGDVVMFNAFFASLSGSMLGLISVLPTLSQIRDAAKSITTFLRIQI